METSTSSAKAAEIPGLPVTPRGTRPTKRVPVAKRRVYTDLGRATDIVLPADTTLRGRVELTRVATEGPLTLEQASGYITDLWHEGAYAIDPDTLPKDTPPDIKENMQGSLNRKALSIRAESVMEITRAIVTNNDDVVSIGGGSSVNFKHSTLKFSYGYIGTHRDLVDCDDADLVLFTDCLLQHEAHCLFWADSETHLNPDWHVGQIDFTRVKFVTEHHGEGRPTRQVHLDRLVKVANVRDCLFDARARETLNVENKATLQTNVNNRYWNSSAGRKAGDPIIVTYKNVAE